MSLGVRSLREARTFRSLQRFRNYRLYFVGQLVSLAGQWMQDTALPWLVLVETHSPVAVGAVIACRFLPFTVLGLFAGNIADRFDNRRCLIGVQIVSMAVAAILAVLAFTDSMQLWQIYVLAVVGGIALVVDGPARYSLTIQLVGRDDLPNAVSLTSGMQTFGRMIGPAIGGIVIAAFGAGWCFAINAAAFLAMLAALLAMRLDELFPVDRSGEHPSALRGLREAAAYVRRTPAVLIVVAMISACTLCGFNARSLVPILSAASLDPSASAFGFLNAAFAAGALVAALLSATLMRPTLRAFLLAGAAWDLCLLALAPVHSAYAAGVLLVAAGFFFGYWNANGLSLIQLSAPDRMRGRVVGFYLFAFVGLQPIGGLLSGWLADVGGGLAAFGLAGGVGLVAVAATAVYLSQVPGLEPPPQAAIADEPLAG